MGGVLQRELTRHPTQSVTWVRIRENGDFEVEFYDHSCIEDSPFPHDYAIRNVVTGADLDRMKALLGGEDNSSDEQFLEAVCRRFTTRPEVEAWCLANGIACEHIYEEA